MLQCQEGNDFPDYDESHIASVLDLGADTLDGFGNLRKQGKLLDLGVKVGDDVFKAHKSFMAALSGHFKKILTEDEAEGPVTVELEGVEAEEVQLVLDFLYEQRLELTLDNIVKVIHVAVHLQIESLLMRCCNFLVQHISRDTALWILEISRTFNLEEVHMETLSFVSENFSEMKDYLMKLGKVDLMALLTGHFCCDSETDLFNMARSWVEASAENLASAGEIMAMVKFPLMSERDLEEIQESTPFLKTEPCCSLIEEAREYHKLDISSRVLVNNKRTKVRGIPRNVVFSTGYSASVGANDFAVPHVLDIAVNLNHRWVKLPNIEHPLGVASIVVVNNFIVACGVGRFLNEGDDVKSDCAIFDPRTYEWFPIASMNKARVDFPLIAVGEAMYALGGSTKWRDANPISDVEVYSFKDNSWSPANEMPEKVTNHAACENSGKIYVCGGLRADDTVSSEMSVFDPATKEWATLPKMLSGEQGHSLLPLTQDQLFVISCQTGKVYSFKLDTHQWMEFGQDSSLSAPSDVVVCQFTPQLLLLSWVKKGVAVRDETEAAAGDSDAAHAPEDYDQAVQFSSSGIFKSPWLVRRVFDFPDGVHWRHCNTLTVPWSVLRKGSHQSDERANMMLQLLQNVHIT